MRSTDPEPGPSMDAFKRAVNIFRAQDAAEDAPVKGEKRSLSAAAISLILIVVTCTYLYFEITWNAAFVATLFEGSPDREQINALVHEGRWLAAFGLAWALVKGVFVRGSTTMLGLVVSLGLVAGTTLFGYAGINRAYERLIDEIPQETAAMLYKSTAHRALAVGGGAEDAASADPMAVMLWPLKMVDDGSRGEVDEDLQAQAEDLKSSSLAMASSEWTKIQAQLATIASMPALMKRFEDGYAEYLAKSRQTLSYIPGSQAKREQQFLEITGMRPNVKATREEFARELLNARIENYRQLGRVYLQTKGGTEDLVVYSAGDVQLKISDLASIKSEEDLLSLVEKKFKDRVAQALSSPELLKKADARDGVAAAALPPIAILLSAFTVVLNAGAVAGLTLASLPVLRRIPQWIWPVATVAGVIAWIEPVKTLPGLEAGFVWINSQSAVGAWIFERLLAVEYLLLSIAI